MQCIVDILHQFNDSFCTDPLRSRTCSNGRAATVPTETGARTFFTIARRRQPETKWPYIFFFAGFTRTRLGHLCKRWCTKYATTFTIILWTLCCMFCCLINRSQKQDDKLMYSVKFRLIRNYILAEKWRTARKTEEKIFTNNVLSICSRIVQLRSTE